MVQSTNPDSRLNLLQTHITLSRLVRTLNLPASLIVSHPSSILKQNTKLSYTKAYPKVLELIPGIKNGQKYNFLSPSAVVLLPSGVSLLSFAGTGLSSVPGICSCAV